MLFNSLEFLLFFPAVCLCYYVIPHRIRYLFLLVCSYFFYMCWNPQYALLMLTSTAITYASGLLLEKAKQSKEEKRRRRRMHWCVALSFISNLAILFFFKYFDFAADTVVRLCALAQIEVQRPAFDVVLPVGISFYTFQALGYTVDVYRGEIYAEKNFLKYALFVSFFPQLVAGPIERSKNLLIQINEKHRFEFARVRDGLLMMLYGYFQKVVLAEYLAIAVDNVYNTCAERTGYQLLIATVLFAFQIYCDFGSYSNIAIGAAKVMGFTLMENFNTPYFSMSVAEFWRRWHISLSTWFRDYLYIPLGGSRCSKGRLVWNLFAVWSLTGLWHGANWTFVCWGLWFFVLLSLEKLVWGQALARLPGIVRHAYALLAVFIGWIFFRSSSLSYAFSFLRALFVPGMGAPDALSWLTLCIRQYGLQLVICLLLSTNLGTKAWNALARTKPGRAVRLLFLLLVLGLSVLSMAGSGMQAFIYAQF